MPRATEHHALLVLDHTGAEPAVRAEPPVHVPRGGVPSPGSGPSPLTEHTPRTTPDSPAKPPGHAVGSKLPTEPVPAVLPDADVASTDAPAPTTSGLMGGRT